MPFLLFSQYCHVLTDLTLDHPGINLGRGNLTVSQQLGNRLNGNTVGKGYRGGKGIPVDPAQLDGQPYQLPEALDVLHHRIVAHGLLVVRRFMVPEEPFKLDDEVIVQFLEVHISGLVPGL